jgi:predicted nuclease of predicted toxin-antitoxin system
VKLIVDMNLSPSWVPALETEGWQAAHWSTIGDPRAADREIMQWARDNDHVVLTHDLDFGALLAASRGQKPSVIQIRTQDVLPATLLPTLVDALHRFENELNTGALIVIEPARERVRILPLETEPG